MRVLSLTLESYPCSSWHHKGKISRAANLSKLSQFLSSPQSPPPSSRLHLFLFFFLNKGMNLITWGRDWKWRLSFSLWFAAEAKLFLFPLESLFSELVIYTRWTSCRLKMPPGWIKLLLPKFLLFNFFCSVFVLNSTFSGHKSDSLFKWQNEMREQIIKKIEQKKEESWPQQCLQSGPLNHLLQPWSSLSHWLVSLRQEGKKTKQNKTEKSTPHFLKVTVLSAKHTKLPLAMIVGVASVRPETAWL